MIKIRKIKAQKAEAVYDITVDNTHSFFANGVLVHNCEILLPTKSFKRLDPTRKTVRVKKDKVDEFMKNKSNDIVKIRKIS